MSLFRCGECPETFDNDEEARDHMVEEHCYAIEEICEECEEPIFDCDCEEDEDEDEDGEDSSGEEDE